MRELAKKILGTMRLPLVGNDPVIGHIFSSTFREEDIEQLCEYVIQHEPKVRHLGTLESAMNEYEKFIDDVHKATGAPDWEYPGQVLIDVLLLRNKLYEAEQDNAELRLELDDARELCGRWMKAAMNLGRMDVHPVFDPNNPEAWATANATKREG